MSVIHEQIAAFKAELSEHCLHERSGTYITSVHGQLLPIELKEASKVLDLFLEFIGGARRAKPQDTAWEQNNAAWEDMGDEKKIDTSNLIPKE